MKRFILVALLLIGIIALYVGCPMNVDTGSEGGMVLPMLQQDVGMNAVLI